MALSSGARLGPYEIVSAIGAGGMGEVYRARDTKLNREVAIKILPELFALDADRRARFEREAQVLASLNHPHIAQIHGFEDSSATCGLVMELVDGQTLAERIEQGPIPLEEALRIARQIGDALEAAHERGIIHRDLKPANIKLTADGAVKILDFGLAKALGPAEGGSQSGPSGLSLSPTFTNHGTQMGVILGTAAYMAPEQARGTPVDKRADIWAFGVVLYEMVTGRRLFDGETVSDTLASVLKTEPDWTRVPAEVRRLVQSCLERDPRKRLRDIGDAWRLVESDRDVPAPAASVPTRRIWLAWAAAAAVLAAVVVLEVLRFTERPPAPGTTRFQVPAPDKTSFDIYLALSPDGRRLAFTARDASGGLHLWVRDMDSLEARVLAGTENAGSPFWSPDSRFIGFAVDRQLRKIDASGGPPQTLCTVPFVVGLGSWNRDGVIVFGARGAAAIHRVSSAGGQPSPVTTLGASRQEVFHSLPAFLPDGRHFIYLRQTVNPDYQGIYLGSLDRAPDAQSLDRLVPGQYSAAFAPSAGGGHILFLREGTLMAQAFDTRTLTTQGDAVPVIEDVGRIGSYGTFSASASGALAYRQGDAGAVTSTVLTWLDRTGSRLSVVGSPGPNLSVDLSPDGSRIAVVRGSTTVESDIWILELARGVTSRFTFGLSREDAPVWSPDSRRIVFRSNRERGGNFDLYQKMSNGASEEVPISKSAESERPSDWSRDARFLAYDTGPSSIPDVYVLPLEGDRTPIPIVQTPASDAQPRFSPDGRWIAYVSNESGRSEVYVRSWSAPGTKVDAAVGKWQVSRDGGSTARWRRDGRELFFRALDGSMMSVDVSNGAGFESGTPRRLFELPLSVSAIGWDVSPDGKRFLVTMPTQAAASAPITVVLNWQQGLRR